MFILHYIPCTLSIQESSKVNYQERKSQLCSSEVILSNAIYVPFIQPREITSEIRRQPNARLTKIRKHNN